MILRTISRFYISSLLLIFSIPGQALDLPGQHLLKQNDAGEYYVVNKKDITMIEPSILKLGFNGRWILACIKNESIDSDLKRWVFIDMKNQGTFDSVNMENWKFYRDEAYPGLKDINLKNYNDEDCP